MAGRSESDYREVVFEREGKEALHGFMRVDRGMVIVSGPVTLPITALRVTPPSWAAIRLAERPSDQSFFSSSTRPSVHDMLDPPREAAKA
jgi:hypothetical protein